MTPFTTTPTDHDPATVSAATATTAGTSADRERSASRRETVLLVALLALAAAVVLFGLAFPGLLAPAVAIAVLVAVVALDWVLPSGELGRSSARYWKH